MLGHEVQRDDVVDGVTIRVGRDVHAADPVDRVDEPGPILDPVGVLLVELGELVNEENRVQHADAIGQMQRVHIRAQVRGEPVLVGPPRMLGSARVLAADHRIPVDVVAVGDHVAGLAGGQQLGTHAREATRVSEAADPPTTVLGAVSLTPVLDQGEAMFIGDLAQRRHVGRLAVDMGGEDRLGSRPDRLADRVRVQEAPLRVHVSEHRECVVVEDRRRRGSPAVGRRDHLGTGRDLEPDEGGVQRRVPRGCRQAAADAVPFGDPALRRVDPGVGPAEADHVPLAQHVVNVAPRLLGKSRVVRPGCKADRRAAEQGKTTVGSFGRPRARQTRSFHGRASVNDSMNAING